MATVPARPEVLAAPRSLTERMLDRALVQPRPTLPEVLISFGTCDWSDSKSYTHLLSSLGRSFALSESSDWLHIAEAIDVSLYEYPEQYGLTPEMAKSMANMVSTLPIVLSVFVRRPG